MSHYRNLGGGKRDSNEPQIMRRFTIHGWHAEQISGNRLWDLIVFHRGNQARPYPAGTVVSLVDVKETNGKVTPAQEEKWKALHAKGIPVYVVRTEAEVDALVGGTLEPWRPLGMGHAIEPLAKMTPQERRKVARTEKPARAAGAKRAHSSDVGRPLFATLVESSGYDLTTPRGSRTWPMGTTAVVPSAEDSAVARAVIAAQEAVETFAPPPYRPVCSEAGCYLEPVRDGKCSDHA